MYLLTDHCRGKRIPGPATPVAESNSIANLGNRARLRRSLFPGWKFPGSPSSRYAVPALGQRRPGLPAANPAYFCPRPRRKRRKIPVGTQHRALFILRNFGQEALVADRLFYRTSSLSKRLEQSLTKAINYINDPRFHLISGLSTHLSPNPGGNRHPDSRQLPGFSPRSRAEDAAAAPLSAAAIPAGICWPQTGR